MATTNKGKRRQLLTDAQYDALYGVPVFSPEEQDHYFSLNGLEQETFDSFRVPGIQVYFVLLLGYTRHSNLPCVRFTGELSLLRFFVKLLFRPMPTSGM